MEKHGNSKVARFSKSMDCANSIVPIIVGS
jgi:hypothetical protein